MLQTYDRNEILQQIYLDRINNYITDATFAEHYGIERAQDARTLIDVCGKVHESIVSTNKAAYKLNEEMARKAGIDNV
jgi:hypothetical protein